MKEGMNDSHFRPKTPAALLKPRTIGNLVSPPVFARGKSCMLSEAAVSKATAAAAAHTF